MSEETEALISAQAAIIKTINEINTDEMRAACAEFMEWAREVCDALVEVFRNFYVSISEAFSRVDWAGLAAFVKSIGKHRPQGKLTPMSRAHVKRAMKRLPNTLAVMR